MTNRDLTLRLATADDIDVIAHVVNTVSEGVVEALLGGLLPGKDAEAVLALVFGRRLATYVPENVVLAEVGGVSWDFVLLTTLGNRRCRP